MEQEIVEETKQIMKRVAEKFGVEILNQELDQDHIHILFKAKPQTELTKMINSLKGVSSRMLFLKFPKIKQKLWNGHLWSPSYCLITTGQVTLDQLKKYVESQGKEK
jgi:REP element-mobilizing transposase RayT